MKRCLRVQGENICELKTNSILICFAVPMIGTGSGPEGLSLFVVPTVGTRVRLAWTCLDVT
jgi:hypothetical protein